jgi:hypothetical protein
MNRFLKIVSASFKVIWYFTGLALLLFLLVVGIMGIIYNFNSDEEESAPQVVVGDRLEKAKSEGKILQGLIHQKPDPIFNTNLLLLPVSVRTYQNPKETNDYITVLKNSSYDQETENLVNVTFIDNNYEVQSVLLEKKAFIQSFRYPRSDRYNNYTSDTLQRNISYLIAFEDTNKDDAIDGDDHSDLYISDLDGKNLIKVTEHVDVIDYYFTSSNEIIIKYSERSNQTEEHRNQYFKKYLVNKKELKELSSLNSTLDELEKVIIQ